LTARLAGCAGVAVLPPRRQQVDITSQFIITCMNTKVTFADRVALMSRAANDLRAILAIIEGEAQAMAEAQERFAAKKPPKRSAKSAE
jgi:hypothetical protein